MACNELTCGKLSSALKLKGQDAERAIPAGDHDAIRGDAQDFAR